jgi:hypothetical protein
MSDLLSLDGWAFTWYQHTCCTTATNPVVINPVLSPPSYSRDFEKITEITYDEYAQYCFHFKVSRKNQFISPFIKAEMLLGSELLVAGEAYPIYLSRYSDDVHEKIDPEKPEQSFDLTVNEDIFSVMLFWPRRQKKWHSPGLYKFRVTLGWRGQNNPNLTWSAYPLPFIMIRVTDVIPK